MKNQPISGKVKLFLSKKTISNLNPSQLDAQVGGNLNYSWQGNSKQCTKNQTTCAGHRTCYNC